MLFASEHITKASGSVGGVTYSHNAGGMYRRARAVPVNPNSGNQLEIRNALTQLVNAWTNDLTPAQRTAWDLYAANVAVTNALGAAVFRSGQNWYIASNTPRLQANAKLGLSLPRVDDAPLIFDRATLTTPTVTGVDVSSGITVAINTADFDSGDAAILVFEGRPQNGSRNFFKGPFRLIESYNNASISPITTLPAQIAANGYVYGADQNVWIRFVLSQGDGRLSTGQIVGPTLSVA